eukprot:scaffold108121_cov54-Attheya_sp.AAC.1
MAYGNTRKAPENIATFTPYSAYRVFGSSSNISSNISSASIEYQEELILCRLYKDNRASQNIMPMFATFEVFQELISWLKELALKNMYSMFFALEVSHELISWLKELALPNMYSMFFCAGSIPRTNILVEGTCIMKHEYHVFCPGSIPRTNILVEGTCIMKHEYHVFCPGSIPRTNIFIERVAFRKDAVKTLNLGYVPLANRPPISSCNIHYISRIVFYILPNSDTEFLICFKSFWSASLAILHPR